MDLQPQLNFGELLIHYGSPLITPKNTVIVPVKIGATNGFRVAARDGKDGTLKWALDTEYSVPLTSFFTPSFGPVLSNGSVAMPAAGGTVLVRDHADHAHGKITRLAFYGLQNFKADAATFTANVQINTPITADREGNLYFGFIVLGPTSVGLQSGLARIGWDGAAVGFRQQLPAATPSLQKSI